MENNNQIDFNKISQFLGSITPEEAGLIISEARQSGVGANNGTDELNFLADGFSDIKKRVEGFRLIPDKESWYFFDYLEQLSQFGVPIPESIDITRISPSDIENWRDNNHTNDEKIFFAVMDNLNHAMAGVKKNNPHFISEAVARIADQRGLTLSDAKKWLKVIEDFSDYQILSGDDYEDYHLILDLAEVESKQRHADLIRNSLRTEILGDVMLDIGEYPVIEELVDLSFEFVDRLYRQTNGDFTELDSLDGDLKKLRDKMSMNAAEFLDKYKVSRILDQIDSFYQEVKPHQIKYPEFERTS